VTVATWRCTETTHTGPLPNVNGVRAASKRTLNKVFERSIKSSHQLVTGVVFDTLSTAMASPAARSLGLGAYTSTTPIPRRPGAAVSVSSVPLRPAPPASASTPSLPRRHRRHVVTPMPSKPLTLEPCTLRRGSPNPEPLNPKPEP
jgi:hypothetical protein